MLKKRVNTVVPIPDQVIKKLNHWGEREKREEYGGKWKFLNRTKEKYDRENDKQQEEEGILKYEYGPLTDLPAELPDIDIEGEQIGPEPDVEEETTSDTEQEMAESHNENLVDENNTTKASALVDEVIYIYDDEVEDLTSDTVREYETRTDEIINTEIEKINNEYTSSLVEDGSDSYYEDNDNIPLE